VTRFPARFEKQPQQAHESAVQERDSDTSRHWLRAQEEERKRISRELHDETGQGLMLLRLQLGMLAAEAQSTEIRDKIQDITELLDRTIAGLRRIIARLSPRTLEELGFAAAVRKEAQGLSKNTGIKARISIPQNFGNLAPEIEVAAYRCVQEALHNTAKHSQARNVTVRIRNQDCKLTLVVEDDGVGISNKHQSSSRGYGLSGIRERVAALGGTVAIDASRKGGTRLRVMLPIPWIAVSKQPSASLKHDAVRRAS
jgi:signal transduction histidine kinase